uniref:Ubiquitin-fold modifier-conjugating enzyme 1 n=1 Tax=Accipiter nisus TaxID=211598 RepID=A0A8B9NLN9_9AVES
MADEAARRAVAELPLLRTVSGPRDREGWASRLKEEYRALIQYVENNKRADNDWFRLESNAEGTRWFGKCWYVHELLKYEFAIEFDGGQDLPQRPLQAPLGQERPQIWLGPSDGAGAGPLAGCGDPRPRHQRHHPAQGEVRGGGGGGVGLCSPPERCCPPTSPQVLPPAPLLLLPNKIFGPGLAPACCSGVSCWGDAPRLAHPRSQLSGVRPPYSNSLSEDAATLRPSAAAPLRAGGGAGRRSVSIATRRRVLGAWRGFSAGAVRRLRLSGAGRRVGGTKMAAGAAGVVAMAARGRCGDGGGRRAVAPAGWGGTGGAREGGGRRGRGSAGRGGQ